MGQCLQVNPDCHDARWSALFDASFVCHSLLWRVANCSQCYLVLCDGQVEQIMLETYEECRQRFLAASDTVREAYRKWYSTRGISRVAPEVVSDPEVAELFQSAAAV